MAQSDNETEEEKQLAVWLIVVTTVFVVLAIFALIYFTYRLRSNTTSSSSGSSSNIVKGITSLLPTFIKEATAPEINSKVCTNEEQTKRLAVFQSTGSTISILHVDFTTTTENRTKLPPAFMSIVNAIKRSKALVYDNQNNKQIEYKTILPCATTGSGDDVNINQDVNAAIAAKNVLSNQISFRPDIIIFEGDNFITSNNVHEYLTKLGYQLVHRKTIDSKTIIASVVYCSNNSKWQSIDSAIKIYDLQANGPNKELDPMHAIVSKFIFTNSIPTSIGITTGVEQVPYQQQKQAANNLFVNFSLIHFDKSNTKQETAISPREPEPSSVLEKAIELVTSSADIMEAETNLKHKSIIWQNIFYDNRSQWCIKHGVSNVENQHATLESRDYIEAKNVTGLNTYEESSIWYTKYSLGLLIHSNLKTILQPVANAKINANFAIFRVGK